jgi:hypothetical protein
VQNSLVKNPLAKNPVVKMAVVLALLMALVAGCGSDDDAGEDSTTTTEAESTTTETETDETDETDEPGEASDHSEDELIEAVATSLSSGDPAGDLVLEDDQAACVGEAWVGIVGVDALNAGGATLEELSKPSGELGGAELTAEQGEAMVAAFEPCDVDIVALMAESLASGLTDEQAACVVEELDPDQAEALLAKTFAGLDADAEFEAVISGLAAACDLPM